MDGRAQYELIMSKLEIPEQESKSLKYPYEHGSMCDTSTEDLGDGLEQLVSSLIKKAKKRSLTPKDSTSAKADVNEEVKASLVCDSHKKDSCLRSQQINDVDKQGATNETNTNSKDGCPRNSKALHESVTIAAASPGIIADELEKLPSDQTEKEKARDDSNSVIASPVTPERPTAARNNIDENMEKSPKVTRPARSTRSSVCYAESPRKNPGKPTIASTTAATANGTESAGSSTPRTRAAKATANTPKKPEVNAKDMTIGEKVASLTPTRQLRARKTLTEAVSKPVQPTTPNRKQVQASNDTPKLGKRVNPAPITSARKTKRLISSIKNGLHSDEESDDETDLDDPDRERTPSPRFHLWPIENP